MKITFVNGRYGLLCDMFAFHRGGSRYGGRTGRVLDGRKCRAAAGGHRFIQAKDPPARSRSVPMASTSHTIASAPVIEGASRTSLLSSALVTNRRYRRHFNADAAAGCGSSFTRLSISCPVGHPNSLEHITGSVPLARGAR